MDQTTHAAITCIALLCIAAITLGDDDGHFEKQPAPAALTVDHLDHEGQRSIRIKTPAGTWIYHVQGAGFASLIDADGNDWISYHPKGGSDGEYRGIPNLAHPAGHFHPGSKTGKTILNEKTSDKATLTSQSTDGKWACRWDIHPDRAELTVTKAAEPYWFLYEGTPGGEVNQGKLDLTHSFCLRSDGQRTDLKKKWTGDIQGDGHTEWVAFGNTRAGRTLLLIHHDDDEAVDSYWPMQGNMTVFGFGRNRLTKHLTTTPTRFTVALIDVTETEAINAAVKMICKSEE